MIDKSPNPMSSIKTKRMLGRSACKETGGERIVVAVAAAAPDDIANDAKVVTKYEGSCGYRM
jgi:hypothetical protein